MDALKNDLSWLDLSDNEEIVFADHPSKWSLAKYAFISLFGVVIGLYFMIVELPK
ncbi:MAG: hypothetical protein ABEK59_03360 [Halobacteria archaeon]